MSTLTEAEIYDRLKTSIAEARDACKNLAVRSKEGRDYSALRDSLKLIEGCCTQMAVHRADYRWLPVGIKIAECHKRAGDWLRGFTVNGTRVAWAKGVQNEAFIKLDQVLEQLGVMADKIRDEKTGIKGPILPASMLATAPRKEGRLAMFNPSGKKPNGLILPGKLQKAG